MKKISTMLVSLVVLLGLVIVWQLFDIWQALPSGVQEFKSLLTVILITVLMLATYAVWHHVASFPKKKNRERI